MTETPLTTELNSSHPGLGPPEKTHTEVNRKAVCCCFFFIVAFLTDLLTGSYFCRVFSFIFQTRNRIFLSPLIRPRSPNINRVLLMFTNGM